MHPKILGGPYECASQRKKRKKMGLFAFSEYLGSVEIADVLEAGVHQLASLLNAFGNGRSPLVGFKVHQLRVYQRRLDPRVTHLSLYVEDIPGSMIGHGTVIMPEIVEPDHP